MRVSIKFMQHVTIMRYLSFYLFDICSKIETSLRQKRKSDRKRKKNIVVALPIDHAIILFEIMLRNLPLSHDSLNEIIATKVAEYPQ